MIGGRGEELECLEWGSTAVGTAANGPLAYLQLKRDSRSESSEFVAQSVDTSG